MAPRSRIGTGEIRRNSSLIFVTVGTQHPFPRLISGINDLAPSLGEQIIAQVCADVSTYPALDVRKSMSPVEYEAIFLRARLIVGHAGIGTVLSAKRFRKPLIVLPRSHKLGEDVNEHQFATARRINSVPGVYVIWKETELFSFMCRDDLTAATDVASSEIASLVSYLRYSLSQVSVPTRSSPQRKH